MKKILAIFLSASLLFSAVPAVLAQEEEETEVPSAQISFETEPALYAHAVAGADDAEAWQQWQSIHDESFICENPSEKYFFLPCSADSSKVELFNAFGVDIIFNGVVIEPENSAVVNYEPDTAYSVAVDEQGYFTVRFMKSNAEAAVYINNSNADKNGTDLMSYLNADKENSAKATGAVVDPDGDIDNTTIKKIKGRGNTTWSKPKKGYNITYDKKVSVGGMKSTKKYSILANYQDDSLSRNRFLYDLSDAVGMPYASDSRFVDFYANGFYWGSYQMCEKIEVGSSSLIDDFEETDYLNEDGTVKEDFPFVCEVDPNSSEEDYTLKSSSGLSITIKAPEIAPGETGYDEVKAYVKQKFDDFYSHTTSRGKVEEVADVDSLTKFWLINELGKNWDSGVASTYFTYKQDENGTYKFYGSPVWDYDNSLGNANGIDRELMSYPVYDYTEYTGWWCSFKGKSSGKKTSTNIINRLSQNRTITEAAPKIWFECFVPAINHFSGEKVNLELDKEFYSADTYFNYIKDSAEMNYRSGWLLNTGSWIADHSSLYKASFDVVSQKMTFGNQITSYPDSFIGMYDYARDWMISRAAWISEQFAESYSPKTVLMGDVTQNNYIKIDDASEIQRSLASMLTLEKTAEFASDTNNDGKITIDDATALQRYLASYPTGIGIVGKTVIYG